MGLSIGIGKRALLDDYYLDELEAVIRQWNELHDPERKETVNVDAMEFLAGEGEWVR